MTIKIKNKNKNSQRIRVRIIKPPFVDNQELKNFITARARAIVL